MDKDLNFGDRILHLFGRALSVQPYFDFKGVVLSSVKYVKKIVTVTRRPKKNVELSKLTPRFLSVLE